jgi:hypothetical protein
MALNNFPSTLAGESLIESALEAVLTKRLISIAYIEFSRIAVV